jgi:hypothetical protein
MSRNCELMAGFMYYWAINLTGSQVVRMGICLYILRCGRHLRLSGGLLPIDNVRFERVGLVFKLHKSWFEDALPTIALFETATNTCVIAVMHNISQRL